MKSLFFFPLVFVSLVLPASALEINWGSAGVDLKMIQSDGSVLTDPPFSFELGSFGTTFIPTIDNAELWASHWKTFDASPYAQGFPDDTPPIPPDPLTGRFGGSAELLSDQTSDSSFSNGTDTFGPSEQAYVWLYDTETASAGAQWALYTRTSNGVAGSSADDAWIFPAFTSGQPGTPLGWFLSGADTAIVGSINMTTVGDGSFTDPSSDFAIRTHVVPEPDVAFLALLAGSLLTARRRRRN